MAAKKRNTGLLFAGLGVGLSAGLLAGFLYIRSKRFYMTDQLYDPDTNTLTLTFKTGRKLIVDLEKGNVQQII